jgi:Tfp pilus assembly protein PilF
MNPKRVIITVLATIALAWAFWQAASTGRARTLAADANNYNDPSAAERAVSLSPSDAEAHAARGGVLQRSGEYPEAAEEYRRAVSLRPRDYYLWMLLGVTADQNGDQDAALRALKQSVSLAPTYAKPHWQLGNVLLRAGETDQAFAELRQSAADDSDLYPNVIDLAWGIHHADVSAVLAAVRPRTDAARFALAIFFARHNQSGAAADQFLAVNDASGLLSDVLLRDLLAMRAFADAYRVWARMHGLPGADTTGTIIDGGFESPIILGQQGFGWQIAPDIPNVTLSIDPSEHQSGSQSVRIEFRGNSTASQPLIAQIILVKPLTKYHLSFSAKGRDIVSAGVPAVILRDASDSARALLGQSQPLRSDVAGWRDFAIDVMTGPKTEAILLTVERPNCNADPCPAFGTLWLDSISIAGR